MFGTGGFQKNINVVVGGNASAYIRQIGMATATTRGFKLGVAAAGAAVVALSAVLIGKAVRAAANFEQAMADVRAVTGATGEDFEALMDKAKELGKVTKFTMTDIGAGMEALGRAGFTTQEILGGVEGAAYLAAAGGISLGEASDISSKAIRALGLEASDAMRVADVFAAAAANANVDVTMLGESLKYVAPLARSAGFSLEETVAAIAKLGDVGIQGSMAGTALRFSFAELLAQSDQMQGVLEDVGLTIADLTGPSGELMSFTEILATLSDAGADTAAIIELVGKRAGPAITALVQENPKLREFVTLLEQSAGAAKEMADIRLDTLKGQLDILRGSWELFLVEIMSGNDVFKGFLSETLIPWVNEMVELEEETGQIGAAITGLFEGITTLFEYILEHWHGVVDGMKALVGVLLALTAVKIITGLKTLVATLWSFVAASAAATAGFSLILAGVAAIGYGVYRVVDSFYETNKAIGDLEGHTAEYAREAADSMSKIADSGANLNEQVGYMDQHIYEAVAAGGDLNEVLGAMLEYVIEGEAQYGKLDEAMLRAAIQASAFRRELEVFDIDAMITEYLIKAMDRLSTKMDVVLAKLKQLNADAVELANIMPRIGIGEAPGVTPLTFGVEMPGTTPTGPTFGVEIPTGIPSTIEELTARVDALGDAAGNAGDATSTTETAIRSWADEFDKLRESISADPTTATEKLVSFMDEFGHIPAAFLAGTRAAGGLLSDLEGLQNAFDVESDITTLEDLLDTQKQAIARMSDLDKALSELDFDDPAAALDELYALSQQYGKPTEMAAIGRKLSELESFVTQLSELPEELRPDNWLEIIDTFDALRNSIADATQDLGDDIQFTFEQLSSVFEQLEFTVGTAQDLWDQFEGLGASTEELTDLFIDYAKSVADQPEILREIHSVLESELQEQRDLLEAQRAFGLATEDTERAIEYLRTALGVTESAADSAAGAMDNAASAANTLAGALRSAALSEIGSALSDVQETIATLQRGTKFVTEEAPGTELALTAEEGGPGYTVTEQELAVEEALSMLEEMGAAADVVSQLREQMYDWGLAGSAWADEVEATYQQIEALRGGMNPEEILSEQQAAADEAQRLADEASRKAQQQAEEAKQKAEQAAKDAAEALRSGFETKFTEPIARALATGDWMASAEAIRAMAQSFPELSQEAAAVSESLRAVGMEGITQTDVLRELTGMESSLASVLEDRMRLAELAGDFELAESLQQMKDAIDEMFSPEEVKTWKQKAAEWLESGFGQVIDAAIGILPDPVSDFVGGLYDIFSTALTNPLAALAKAIQFGVEWVINSMRRTLERQLEMLEKKQDELQARLDELTSVFDFWIDTLTRVAGVLKSVFSGPLGSIAGTVITAFIDSLRMLTMDGLDLVTQAISVWANVMQGLVSVISNLIKKSDAYAAVQEQTNRAWKAVSDLLGQFLWPMAALIKHILDWLGIQEDVNAAAQEALAEVGVPRIWKREFRRWQAAAPGEIVTGGGTGEVEIPAWATAIVEGLAEAIEALLERHGITSWDDLISRFVAGSTQFWNYVNAHIPELIGSLDSIFGSVEAALGGGIVQTIVNWLQRGFDWLIHDAPGFVQKALDFIDIVSEFGTFLWDKISNLDIDGLLEDIKAAFGEAMDILDDMEDNLQGIDQLGEIATEIGKVKDELNDVEHAIDRTRYQIEHLEDTFKVALAVAAGAIIGGIAGALSAPGLGPITWAAAVVGAGVAGVFTYALMEALGALPGYQHGGVVPGRIGEPVIGLLHGQEEVLSYQQRQQRGQAVIVQNHNHFYVDGREVAFATAERTQHISKFQTGNKNSTAALTRRVR